MKSILFSALLLIGTLLSSEATAQVIVITPGSPCVDPCPPPVVPCPPRRAPRYKAPPVAAVPIAKPASVPAAPDDIGRGSRSFVEKLLDFKRFGSSMYFSFGSFANEYDAVGMGFAVSYMLSRHLGVEGAIEGMTMGLNQLDSSATVLKAALSGLWFPSGMVQRGFSYYLKGGLVSQTFTPQVGGYEFDSVSGSSYQVGAGVRWSMADGSLSTGFEWVYVSTPQSDELNYSQGDLSSTFFNWTISLHF